MWKCEVNVVGGQRGRPRSEQARRAILDAAGELMLEGGLGAASVEAIAARAGVTTEVTTQIATDTLPEGEYEWVVDSTGSPEGLQAAVRMAQPCGTVILKSTVHGTVAVDTAPVIVNEITLVGSRCGRFEPALELLERGAVDVTSMISEAMALRDAPRAFSRAGTKGVLKVLLTA